MSSRHLPTLAAAASGIAVIVLVTAAFDPTRAVVLGAFALIALLGSAAALVGLAREGSPPLRDALARLDRRVEGADEERRRMRGRAETAGRFREEFVGAVRHELKTPLNAILGFTQVLLQEVDGPLEPRQREDVDAIRGAGLYLQELVEAVLQEWVPAQDAEAALADVEIGPLFAEVVRLLAGQVAGRSVTLSVEVADDLPRLRAEPLRLRQILINLGTNGIRATRRGSVTLSATREGDDHIRLTVRDTGAGMSASVRERLFQPFEQGGDEESRRGGSGLGLSITHEMVEWHGGRIEVESTPGVGSAFHVILPADTD